MIKIIEDIAHYFWNVSADHKVYTDRGSDFRISVLESHEKRLATRIEVDVPVWYRTESGFARWNLTKSKDYSSSGIRIVLLHPVPPGTGIEIKIKLPELDNLVQMRGHVVWVAQNNHRHSSERVIECGVAFDPIQKSSQKEKFIYLIADKLSNLGLKSTRHLKTHPANNLEELKKAYEIVYKGYVKRGYCKPNESKMFYHHYSFLPKSKTFVLKEKDTILGTISVVVDTSCGLPMDCLFSKELDALRRQKKKLAEVTLLALDIHQKSRLFSLTNFEKQARLFRLFKVMYEYAHNYAGVTDLIIGVHPKHASLYKFLKFRPLAAIKSYEGACGNLALPLHLQIKNLAEQYSTSLRAFFMSETTPENVMTGGHVLTAECVRYFLSEQQSLWANIPPEGKKYLFECYPGLDSITGIRV